MGTQEPKYKAVVRWVLEELENGRLKMGGKLPSENDLSQQFALSRQTIRHAIDVLEQQHLVTRVKGSGTYIGSEIRQGRSRERSHNIAVISTYVNSYIFPQVLQGIEQVLAEKGYTTQIAFTGNQVGREKEIISSLLEKDNIDGLIVEPARSALPNPNLQSYRTLRERQVPVLFFNSSYPELGLPCVSMDDTMAGQNAVRYLVQKGHSCIGGIFKSDDGQGRLRYAGFLKGMEEAGLKLQDQNVYWFDTNAEQELPLWGDYLLHRLSGCTAVVCYNDEIASHLMEFCQKKGVAVPEQLSIIGIDNSDLCTRMDVALTSFSHPMEALGWKVAENITRMIEDPFFDGSYLFETEVVARDSVRQLGTV